MTINCNVAGEERKRLAEVISQHVGIPKRYAGMPSCAYLIGDIKVSKDGKVTWDGEDDKLLSVIKAEGFIPIENPEENDDTEKTAEGTGLTISMPQMAPDAIIHLQKLVDSKASLIRKALNASTLVITQTDKLNFPWWSKLPTQEETTAYMAFIAALCRMAQDAKRVIAIEKPVESEKYAFRILLLRLGFSGDENKAVRQVLLKRLSGHTAFRNAEKEQKFKDRRKALVKAANAEAPADVEVIA